jgi:hypothetical protein
VKNQIYSMQSVSNLFGFGLILDGILGPMSTAAQLLQASLLPHVASLPQDRRGTKAAEDDLVLMGGRASTFGGETDYGDMFEGHAYMPIADPDGGGPKPAFLSPAEYYSRLTPAQKRWIRPEMATYTTWPTKRLPLKDAEGNPMLTRSGAPMTYLKTVGVSWFMAAEDEPGAAARLRGPLHEAAKAGREVWIEFTSRADRSKRLWCRVVDWGPTERMDGTKWRYDFDLYPFAYRQLGLSGTRGKHGYYQDHIWISQIEVR